MDIYSSKDNPPSPSVSNICIIISADISPSSNDSIVSTKFSSSFMLSNVLLSASDSLNIAIKYGIIISISSSCSSSSCPSSSWPSSSCPSSSWPSSSCPSSSWSSSELSNVQISSQDIFPSLLVSPISIAASAVISSSWPPCPSPSIHMYPASSQSCSEV